MIKQLFTGLLALFLLGGLMSGCGGGSGETTGASPTKQQFIQKAGQICEQIEKEELDGILKYGKKNPGSEEEDWVKPIFIPALEKQMKDIEAIGFPSQDRKELALVMQAYASALDDTKSDPGALLASSTNPFKRYNHLVKKYGLIKCSYVP